MSKKELSSICQYGLARVVGGILVWLPDIEPNLVLFTTVDGLYNDLELQCLKPATPQELTDSPGNYIPFLKHILGDYENIRAQHDAKPSSVSHLPNVFAITATPLFRWRFATMKAELLASLFPSLMKPTRPADYIAVYYEIFNFSNNSDLTCK